MTDFEKYSSNMSKLFVKGRTLALAYDHGMEHGPTDFNLNNSKPDFIFEIAEKTKVNALVTQIGIAEKYSSSYNVPLIIKLNGKTRLSPKMISRQVCSIKRAERLNPIAVGYTIYPGSEFESKMFHELSKIIEESHEIGLPVVVWSYPRNERGTIRDTSTDILAYAARIALELGADVVKLKYNNDLEGFKWVVHNAGKVKIVVAGSSLSDPKVFLHNIVDALKAGASGAFVGRNVWQAKEPYKVVEALKDLIFNYEDPDRAYERYFKSE